MNTEEQMLTSLLNCRRVDLYADKKILTDSQKELFLGMKSRLSSGEPLQYILGSVDFMGISLHIDNRVLIPRPETEILVEAAIRLLKEKSLARTVRILDLGTGSGNIAIALAKNIFDSVVTTVDISSDAIVLAKRNAEQNNIFDKINFIHQDMTEFLKRAINNNDKFDLIISNPPYIPTEQIETLPLNVQQEPRIALDGGADGLDFYREIIFSAPLLLEKNGALFLEIGDGQEESIKNLVEAAKGYKNYFFQKDYVGTTRITIITRE